MTNTTARKEIPTRQLICNCCGAYCRGRQWHNRDTGFGLCLSCGDMQEKKYGIEEVKSWSGIRGYNWGI